MYSTVDEYLADKEPAAVDVFLRFRKLVLALGDDVHERVHRSEISWARTRVFAAAFVYASRLEVAIDLPRRIHHRALREAFPTNETVTTHRLSIASADELDAQVKSMLIEAYERVGPGLG
ncbi:DUF5655 domain-containing protein [Rhodococcus chondri]|uniref:DUF5655 domain-containing protein n=1 Tax=Rhodococcus chondri TaxID=3065941 RepID=A0ABU7JZ00_9NOCA|nr:DUF5655 domain-containing protein [Rhodococcus sp. CC-R104]MEE2035233.1 DUF5655 domain-containing protein [Rhodococcus sp. CC-R104]